jgi:hypothetical protein
MNSRSSRSRACSRDSSQPATTTAARPLWVGAARILQPTGESDAVVSVSSGRTRAFAKLPHRIDHAPLVPSAGACTSSAGQTPPVAH